jgi:TPR repeat protein
MWYQSGTKVAHIHLVYGFDIKILYTGEFRDEDNGKAAEWYKKAPNQGLVAGQHNLALLLLDGKGVGKDETRATELLVLAADQGRVSAQNILEECFRDGRGLDKDKRKAAEWFKKATEQGHAAARDNLSQLLLVGGRRKMKGWQWSSLFGLTARAKGMRLSFSN